MTETHAKPIVFEEGGLSTKHIRMQAEEASSLLRSAFGVQGELSRLNTEKDDTFLVHATDGAKFILKIANPAERSSELDFEVRLLMHVATADKSLPVPRVITGSGGRPYLSVRDQAGQLRLVRLLSYLEGTPLDRTTSSAASDFA